MHPLLYRYGPLDLAVINNHRECSDFLILHKARTHGGKAHRAACTIQLSWRYHVHKVSTVHVNVNVYYTVTINNN